MSKKDLHNHRVSCTFRITEILLLAQQQYCHVGRQSEQIHQTTGRIYHVYQLMVRRKIPKMGMPTLYITELRKVY